MSFFCTKFPHVVIIMLLAVFTKLTHPFNVFCFNCICYLFATNNKVFRFTIVRASRINTYV